MSDQLQFNGREQQPELPPNSDGSGYAKFQTEQVEFFRELGNRYGISLNRLVRIKLKNLDREFEGKLVMAQLLPPDSPDDEFRLRVGSIEFFYTDIEHAVLLEE